LTFNRLDQSAARPRATDQAFTLVEILVVISIIGLLAGLAFPAIQGAQTAARKGKAKAEIQSIITSLKAYQNEYGRIPDSQALGGGADGWFGTNESKNLFWMLSGNNYGEQNPRQITFLELSGTSTNGVFLDPWKRHYVLKIDTDGDNIVEYYGNKNGVAVVLSFGKNGKQDAPTDAKSDDVYSFK